ncbi:helix-turn-helix transcriptional regulator [Alteromonas sp. RKMC-009]|uniref:helix-turn-helix transcriptional regulator n=1 Tax=Alteromonas sp. RKMC-009 TaxID=2267264 RepID=UPI000C508E2E|nr:helix-turn-helix domain-containing protein [Alteromonas sp. RKMC-009]AYA63479.1 DNA-binding protein [Alteromonas sp. RKMC-009]MBT79431.1 DNA-binding protein [Alteromonadaceae bacterium]
MKNQWSENVNTGELLTSLELMSMLSISSTTLWRHVKNGELPKPVYIGKKRYWKRASIIGLLG